MLLVEILSRIAFLSNIVIQPSVGGDHWSPGKAGSHRSPPYAMTSSQDWSGQGPEHGWVRFWKGLERRVYNSKNKQRSTSKNSKNENYIITTLQEQKKAMCVRSYIHTFLLSRSTCITYNSYNLACKKRPSTCGLAKDILTTHHPSSSPFTDHWSLTIVMVSTGQYISPGHRQHWVAQGQLDDF